MAIKAIVLDIDGTLLNSDKEISPRTKEVLIRAQKKGLKLVLASGRPTRGIMEYADILEMQKYNGLLVSYNGARVEDCETNEILFDEAISIADGKAVLQHLQQFDVIPMLDKDDYMYVNNVFNNEITWRGNKINIIEHEARGGNYKLCEKADLAAFLDYKINKILTAGDPQYLAANYKAIMEPFENKLNGMFTADFYFEFTAKGIDKAKALASALRPLNITKDDIIAFGDGENDISLVQYAGIGVAMENAVTRLKEQADKITLSNDHDGIAHMLETLI